MLLLQLLLLIPGSGGRSGLSILDKGARTVASAASAGAVVSADEVIAATEADTGLGGNGDTASSAQVQQHLSYCCYSCQYFARGDG